MQNDLLAGLCRFLKSNRKDFTDIQNLSLALENGINHTVFTKEEINQLLDILSPFENAMQELPGSKKITSMIMCWGVVH